VWVEETGPAMEKLLAEATRAKARGRVEAHVPGSRVDKCRCSGVFPSAVSTTLFELK
jgi:hypothetical protein